MAVYEVQVFYETLVEENEFVEVEADSQEEAEELALEDFIFEENCWVGHVEKIEE